MHTATYELTIKPSFWNDILTLPSRKVARQVQQKIDELQQNPLPDGHHKKKLKGHRDPVYRLRIGDYRLFYTFGEGWIRLLAIRLRRDAYEDDSVGYEEPAVVPPAEQPPSPPPPPVPAAAPSPTPPGRPPPHP